MTFFLFDMINSCKREPGLKNKILTATPSHKKMKKTCFAKDIKLHYSTKRRALVADINI